MLLLKPTYHEVNQKLEMSNDAAIVFIDSVGKWNDWSFKLVPSLVNPKQWFEGLYTTNWSTIIVDWGNFLLLLSSQMKCWHLLCQPLSNRFVSNCDYLVSLCSTEIGYLYFSEIIIFCLHIESYDLLLRILVFILTLFYYIIHHIKWDKLLKLYVVLITYTVTCSFFWRTMQLGEPIWKQGYWRQYTQLAILIKELVVYGAGS